MHTESKIASSEATNWRWFLTALTVIIVIAIIIMIYSNYYSISVSCLSG